MSRREPTPVPPGAMKPSPPPAPPAPRFGGALVNKRSDGVVEIAFLGGGFVTMTDREWERLIEECWEEAFDAVMARAGYAVVRR